jgi:ABC-2 type transport system permease protein
MTTTPSTTSTSEPTTAATATTTSTDPGADGASTQKAGTNRSAVDQSLRDVLGSGARPPRPNLVSTSLTFGWRALLKIKHVPEQLFDVTMFPIMFTLIFTYLFGGALAGSPREYLQDLLPGILVMNVTFITIYTGMVINTDIGKGVFDRFRSLPIWRPSVLAGAMIGDAARFLMASLMVIVLGVILGFRPDGGVVGVALATALVMVFSFSLSWIWTALGLVVRTPESLMTMSMTVMFPLTFTSNVFVDPDTMPGWLQGFVDVNPITRLVNASRALMHGESAAGDIGWVFLSCALIVAVFAPLTLRLYAKER